MKHKKALLKSHSAKTVCIDLSSKLQPKPREPAVVPEQSSLFPTGVDYRSVYVYICVCVFAVASACFGGFISRQTHQSVTGRQKC